MTAHAWCVEVLNRAIDAAQDRPDFREPASADED
jgi:hypothetical protein